MGYQSWFAQAFTTIHLFDCCNLISFCVIYCSYGIKTVNGMNRLSGDGLEAKDVAGMMQGGGKWPGRYVQGVLPLKQ